MSKLRPTDSDLVVINLWSNTAHMGMDELGLAMHATKIKGRYHIFGKLQAAPRTAFEVVFDNAAAVLETAGEAQVLLVVPLPRYVLGRCCDDRTHLTNWKLSPMFLYIVEKLRL